MNWRFWRRKKSGVLIALTPTQWYQIALRSGSDYHDWNDAANDAPCYGRDRKVIRVGTDDAAWITGIFGQEVVVG